MRDHHSALDSYACADCHTPASSSSSSPHAAANTSTYPSTDEARPATDEASTATTTYRDARPRLRAASCPGRTS